jgi:hypothetical protein
VGKLATHISASGPKALTISVVESAALLSLRYMGIDAQFVEHMQAALGCSLPETLQAQSILLPETGHRAVLAWRRPSETLLLAETHEIVDRFAEIAATDDGYVLDLTGGFTLFSCEGALTAQMCARLGGPDNFPQPGEAKPGRLAEVPALALSLQDEQCQILVERHFGPHMDAWIRHAIAHLI